MNTLQKNPNSYQGKKARGLFSVNTTRKVS